MSDKIVIDLSGPALNMMKEPLFADHPRATLGWTLGQLILCQATEGPVIKFVLWAYALAEQRPLELDGPDYETLHELIDKSRQSAIVKAPIMMAMQAAKDESKKVLACT